MHPHWLRYDISLNYLYYKQHFKKQIYWITIRDANRRQSDNGNLQTATPNHAIFLCPVTMLGAMCANDARYALDIRQ